MKKISSISLVIALVVAAVLVFNIWLSQRIVYVADESVQPTRAVTFDASPVRQAGIPIIDPKNDPLAPRQKVDNALKKVLKAQPSVDDPAAAPVYDVIDKSGILMQ